MTERELAENICRVHARTLVDEAGGITLGGDWLAERHYALWKDFDSAQALRHWVEAAGYDKEGNFKYIISNHIQNY